LFFVFTSFGANPRSKKGLTIVWHAVVRGIWKTQNDIFFSSEIKNAEQFVDQIHYKKNFFCQGRNPLEKATKAMRNRSLRGVK